MTITAQDLVTAFPEFGNAAAYPITQIDFWIGQAKNQLSEATFGASYDLATMLFVAHNIVLSAQNARAAAGGGGVTVGAPAGIVTSKAVGGVSKSMDVNLAAYAGAGVWNATAYGQRYYQMLKAAGAGPQYRVPARVGAPYGYGGAFGRRW